MDNLDYRCVEELVHALGPDRWARLMGKTDMKVGVECIPVGKMLVGLRQDREQRDTSHNYTALPRATFLLVIREAFMLASLVSQRRP